MANDHPEPFGTPALLAARYAIAVPERVRAALVDLASRAHLSLDEALLAHLSAQTQVFQLEGLEHTLREAMHGRLSPEQRERLAARRYVAAIHLFELVPDPFDGAKARPPTLSGVMADGAEGLLTCAWPQWRDLAEGLDALAHAIAERNPAQVVVLDAPRGSTIPARVLCDVLVRRGLTARRQTLLAPRRERGAVSVRSVVRAVASAIEDDALVVYVDDVYSGTRFSKLLEAVEAALGPDRILAQPIALDRPPADPDHRERRDRLIAQMIQRRALQRSALSPTLSVRARPPLHVDDGPPILLLPEDSEFAWIGSELIIGARKVNFIFDVIHRWRELASEFEAPNSPAIAQIQALWSNAADGRRYRIAPGLVAETLGTFVRAIDWNAVLAAAQVTFAGEYGDDPVAPVRTVVDERHRWLLEVLRRQVEAVHGEQPGWVFARAMSDLAAHRMGHWPVPSTKSYRDHRFAAYLLPYCGALRTFQERLVAHLVRMVLDPTARSR